MSNDDIKKKRWKKNLSKLMLTPLSRNQGYKIGITP